MNTKKVYIVTEGSYSDYHIRAVFSTLELAQEYLDTINKNTFAKYGKYPRWGKIRSYEEWLKEDYDIARVEEYDLYDMVPALRWNEQYQWTEEVKDAEKADMGV